MQNQIDALSNVHQEVQSVLKAMARQNSKESSQLVLKIVYENGLMVEDTTTRKWKVDEKYIDIFAHIYKNAAFKIVRLPKWKVELKFNGKACTRIEVVASDAQFCSQQETKRASACHFAFAFSESTEDFQTLNAQIKGYLNRLGKRELCSVSMNIHKKVKSLIFFAKRQSRTVYPLFNYNAWKSSQKEVSPKDALSDQGLKVLEKIRHFVKADHLLEFATKNSLSEQCTEHIKQLLAKKYLKEQAK